MQHQPWEGVHCCLHVLLEGQIPSQHTSNARNITQGWLPRNSAGGFSPLCLSQTPDLCLLCG